MSDEIRVETWQIGSIDSPSPSHWRHESQSSDGTVTSTLTRPRCPVALRAPGPGVTSHGPPGRHGRVPLAGGTSSSQTVTVSVGPSDTLNRTSDPPGPPQQASLTAAACCQSESEPRLRVSPSWDSAHQAPSPTVRGTQAGRELGPVTEPRLSLRSLPPSPEPKYPQDGIIWVESTAA